MGVISKLFLAAFAIGGVNAFSTAPVDTSSGRTTGGDEMLPTDTYNMRLLVDKVGWQQCLDPKYMGTMQESCVENELANQQLGTCSAIIAAKGDPIRIGKDIGMGACNKLNEAQCPRAYARAQHLFADGIYDAVYDCAWNGASCVKAKEYQGCFPRAQMYVEASAELQEAGGFAALDMSPGQTTSYGQGSILDP